MTLPLNAFESSLAESPVAGEFLVICLCAEWCGTCRDYRPGFEELATRFPGVRFRWLDIEEQADDLGDLDIENFPTLFIQRQDSILFYGTMLPHLGHLQRMIETFQEQPAAQSREYAHSNPERRGWQIDADLLGLKAAVSA